MDKSQSQKILDYLRTGKTITPMEALSLFGCFRLAARISDIKDAGHIISSVMVEKNGKRFAQYHLVMKTKRRAA